MSETGVFAKLSDDIILNILYKLEDDPRNWATISCVSTKLASLITTVCCRAKCSQSIPAVVSDLLQSTAPPTAWASLYKLALCCPGLLHSGVRLEDDMLLRSVESESKSACSSGVSRSDREKDNRLVLRSIECDDISASSSDVCRESSVSRSDRTWLLHDDMIFDSESLFLKELKEQSRSEVAAVKPDLTMCKRRKICRSIRSHLASGIWNLSREQGNKLLASRFKGDCLYICDWPGCIHIEEKRNYMLFRGIFKNFKQSRVWRTIDDGDRSKKIDSDCVFCSSKQMWDLHSSFCLRRYFGYHDDGEPVVRAYVCENGHVSGAWTDWPLYT